MILITFGTDKKVFEKDSAVQKRMASYTSLAKELFFVVYTKKSDRYTPIQIADNVRVYPTNSLSLFTYVFDVMRIARRLISKSEDQVVVSAPNPFFIGFIAYIFARLFSCTFHVQVHTDIFSPYFTKNFFRNHIYKIFALFILPRADCVRVVSKRIQDSIITKCKVVPENIYVQPIYVSTKKTESVSKISKFSKHNPVILTVARLEKEKNIQLAIDVLVDVRKKHKDACLVIVGDGSQRQYLEKYTKRKGVASSVYFEGWQKNTADYYVSADVFLLTSLYEGYSMAMVEAALYECPIVTTDVGISGDILKHGEDAFVSDVGNKIKLVEHIIRVVSESDFGTHLSEHAKDTIAEHLYEEYAEYLDMVKGQWKSCCT